MSRLKRKEAISEEKSYLEEITEGNTKRDIEEIPLNLICERYKNRFIINPKKSHELRESINSIGLREPLNVVRISNYIPRDEEEKKYLEIMTGYGCKYFVSSGHRRFKALVSNAIEEDINKRSDLIDFYNQIDSLKKEGKDPYSILGETTTDNKWFAKCIVVDSFQDEEKERRSYADTNTTGRAGSTTFELVGLAIDNLVIEKGLDIYDTTGSEVVDYIKTTYSVTVPLKPARNMLAIFRNGDSNFYEVIYEGKLSIRNAVVLAPIYKSMGEEEKETVISEIWEGSFKINNYIEKGEKSKTYYTKEQVKDILQKIKAGWTTVDDEIANAYSSEKEDYADIKGQEKAKRATQVAVAGFHNLMYIGPPGSGKSMMAKRIPGILSRLSRKESLEVSKVYSVMGLLQDDSLVLRRPFRSPHHSITGPALVGGSPGPRPGEITLAHDGVLFLDEAAEFKKDVIEMLRQPLEDKQVVISRTSGNMVFPCDFMLVMAANPCRCGYYPDRRYCRCSQADVDRYFGKLNGPVLDRIDICVGTSKLEVRDFGTESSMDTSGMRKAVCAARAIQERRFEHDGIQFNAQMNRSEIEKNCILDQKSNNLLDRAYAKFNMSARGYYKILKVARTIADLDGCADIRSDHIAEALGYRNRYEG